MTIVDACRLRAEANRLLQQVRRDSSLDTGKKRRFLNRIRLIHEVAAELMEIVQDGEPCEGRCGT
jgi:hypothetical protein